MRKLFTAICLASAIGLAGCATPGSVIVTGPTTGTPSTGIDIEQVRSIATTVCGFLPTVSTVAGILASFTGAGPIVATAGEIAAQICAVVVPARSAARSAVGKSKRPSLRGVPIHGQFVR